MVNSDVGLIASAVEKVFCWLDTREQNVLIRRLIKRTNTLEKETKLDDNLAQQVYDELKELQLSIKLNDYIEAKIKINIVKTLKNIIKKVKIIKS